MNCDESITLLHLHRPGERTEAEESALTRHVAGCERCTAEKARIERTARAFQKTTMLRTQPSIDLDALVDGALNERRRDVPVADRLLGLWERPAIRVAHALALAACLLAMFLQLRPSQRETRGVNDQGTAFVSVTVGDVRGAVEHRLPADLSRVVEDLEARPVRQTDLRSALKRTELALLGTLRLTEEQKALVASILEELRSTSLFHVQLERTGDS